MRCHMQAPPTLIDEARMGIGLFMNEAGVRVQ
jgi:hypothetical protein